MAEGREEKKSDARSDCLFCSPEFQSRKILHNETMYAVYDKYPVTEGHCLVIPFRHVPDFFQLTEQERMDADDLTVQLSERARRADSGITGFNLGWNCGKSAGQTILHAHLHVIPRRDGDMEQPRGGVRGVIPEKRVYPFCESD